VNKQYIVILTFPQKIETEIKALRDKYNKATSQIIPHVTLKQPSYLLSDESSIKEELREIARVTNPFIIELDGLSYFQNQKNTAYIALKDKTSVTELHKKIVYALQGKVDEVKKERFELENFTPHATIGEYLSKEDIKIIKQELSYYNPSYSIPIDSFSLYSADSRLQWEPVEEFKLG